MKTIYSLQLIYLLVFLSACMQEKTSDDSQKAKEPVKKNVISDVAKPKIFDKQVDNTTTIKFSEFHILISRLSVWDPDTSLNMIQGDSCYIVNEIGDTVLGQNLKILNTNLIDLKIDQKYETSISISNEGPHCDLLDWKHFNTEWIETKSINKFEFQCVNYSEEEKSKFPIINIDELKQYVKVNCGDEWFQLIKDINKPNDGASWVGISKVFLRISGTNPKSGKRIIKIIVFEEAMGC